jgi:predicted dehydrogenase
MAHTRVSWLDPEKIRRVKVTGSRGIAIFDDAGKDSVVEFHEDWIEPKGAGDFAYHKNKTPEIFELDKVEPLKLECEHFAECVIQGKKPLTDGQNGVDVVTILERAEESLKEKGAYKPL